MSSLSINLPESLHSRLKEFAERQGVSVDRFIALAIAERIASLRNPEYPEARRKQGSREEFVEVLSRVKDVEPDEEDRL